MKKQLKNYLKRKHITIEDVKDDIKHGYKLEIFEEIKEDTDLSVSEIDAFLNKLEK